MSFVTGLQLIHWCREPDGYSFVNLRLYRAFSDSDRTSHSSRVITSFITEPTITYLLCLSTVLIRKGKKIIVTIV